MDRTISSPDAVEFAHVGRGQCNRRPGACHGGARVWARDALHNGCADANACVSNAIAFAR